MAYGLKVSSCHPLNMIYDQHNATMIIRQQEAISFMLSTILTL